MSFLCGRQRKGESRTRTSYGIAEMDCPHLSFRMIEKSDFAMRLRKNSFFRPKCSDSEIFHLIFGRATSWELQTSSESPCMPRRSNSLGSLGNTVLFLRFGA